MSFLSDLSAGAVSGILGSVGQLAKDIRGAITGQISPEKKADVELKLLELESASQQAQALINQEEAKHPSVFVAGWRPFIGWVCGFSLAYYYVVRDLATWILSILKITTSPLPTLQTGELMTLLFGLLGLGGLRTFEKIKDVQGKH